MDNDTCIPSISFSYGDDRGNESTYINMKVETETYTDIVEKFRWFLQAIGYSYIANVAVYNEEGEELFSTSI